MSLRATSRIVGQRQKNTPVVVGRNDLAPCLSRAGGAHRARQQQGKLVATQARHRVGIANHDSRPE